MFKGELFWTAVTLRRVKSVGRSKVRLHFGLSTLDKRLLFQRGILLEHREANRQTNAPIGLVASGRNSDRTTAQGLAERLEKGRFEILP